MARVRRSEPRSPTEFAGIEMIGGASGDASVVYRKEEKLGAGAYGQVYKAKCKRTGRTVAIKCLKLGGHSDDDSDGVPSSSLREISLLQELKGHPHVVTLIGVHFGTDQRVELVFEYMEQDLSALIRSTSPLPLITIKEFLRQMLSAVDACHSRGIMHRDLKPQNILVNSEGPTLKLADFGLARAFTPPLRKYTHEIVTLWYRAPEVLLGASTYGPPVDIWSVGAIFIELLIRKPVWRGECEIAQLFAIFRSLGTPDETTWPGVTKLRDFNSAFPYWHAKAISRIAPGLDPAGEDLLKARERLSHLRSNNAECANPACLSVTLDDLGHLSGRGCSRMTQRRASLLKQR